MSKGRSGHGGEVEALFTVKAMKQWLDDFSTIVAWFEKRYEKLNEEERASITSLKETITANGGGSSALAQSLRVETLEALGRFRGKLEQMKAAVCDGQAVLEAIQEIDLPAVEQRLVQAQMERDQHEQRLVEIDTSVRAKQEHLAALAKEQEQIEVELGPKRQELDRVKAELQKYHDQIAAL